MFDYEDKILSKTVCYCGGGGGGGGGGPAPKPKRQASTPVAAIEGRGSAKAVDADDDAVPSPSAQRRKDRMGKRRFRVGLDVNVANVEGLEKLVSTYQSLVNQYG